MLASSLMRNAPLAELESRKAKCEEAYIKWNVQRYNTYLTLQEIDIAVYPRVKQYDDSLRGCYMHLDQYLTHG
jgi:hypothetical protein